MSEAAVTTERTIAADPEAVWDALTTDDGFAAWSGRGATIDPVPGGRIHAPDPATGVERVGAVERIEPPTDLLYRWWPVDDPDRVSTVEVTVEATPEGANVTVIERLVVPPTATPSASAPQLMAA